MTVRRCLLALVFLAASASLAGVAYVDVNVTGGAGNGASWEDAYTNLAVALTASSSGTDLWVVEGTYTHTDPFQMKSGVNLYGGFTNGAAGFDERDWKSRATVLNGQGARTAIYGASGAILDGFVITNGAALRGGGMYNNAVAPTVRNCVFANNAAGAFGGGAVYNAGEAADAVFENCAFFDNSASGAGGAMFADIADPTILDSRFLRNRSTGSAGGGVYNAQGVMMTLAGCTFTSNRAATLAGAIYTTSGNSLSLTNCVFEMNRSDQNAGAIYAYFNTLSWRDCRFVGNVASRAGAIYNEWNSKGFIEDCVFAGNQATNGSGGAYSSSYAFGSLTNRNCVFVGNTATSASPGTFAGSGGAFSCSGDNSVFEACVFSGNRAAGYGGVFSRAGWDYPSDWRLKRCILAGNESGVGGGAYHGYGGGNPLFENCLFTGNAAPNGGVVTFPTESASGFKAVHCTFSGNRATTSGGAWLTGSSYVYATNNIFWDNSAGVAGSQIHQQIASRASVGYSDVQGGWTGLGVANFDADPLFTGGPTGIWSAVSAYDPAAGQTALTDGGAGWTADAYAGLTVNPDLSQWLQFAIASNTIDTLYVWGDARANRAGSAVTDVGDSYRIHFYLPCPTSPVLDRGVNAGINNDLAGAPRPREDAPDPGAYEIQDDVIAPLDISNLLAAPLHRRIEFSWDNPPVADLTGILIVRKEGSAPSGVPIKGQTYSVGEPLGDGTVVHANVTETWTDDPLNPGVTYHYAFYAFDDVANYSGGVATNGTPVDDTTPPGAVSGLTAAGGTGVVSLAWTNPSDLDFGGVLIVRRTGSDPTGTPVTGVKYSVGEMLGDGLILHYGTASNAAPGDGNEFVDAGLADSTEYRYAVFAFDRSRNYAGGETAGATTAVDVVPPDDVTGLSLRSGDGWVELSWTHSVTEDSAGVLVLRRAGEAPTGAPTDTVVYEVGETVDDGAVVYNADGLPGGAGLWRDEGVTNGVVYFYTVFARDEVPNYSGGVGGSETPLVRDVLYVDWQALGANDGSSWSDAFTSLTSALTAAKRGTNIWVAAGTYKPGVTRTDTFALKAGVGVYGGFTNGMGSLRRRDWNAHVTTLSGDLDGNGVADVGNAYHVVTATGATDAALDGFTVTLGYAYNPLSGDYPYPVGGGLVLWNSDAAFAVRNCTFENNAANYGGGAMCIRQASRAAGGVTISNCTFRGNSTFRVNDNYGGAIYHVYRTLEIVDSVFEDNSGYIGGAIYGYNGDPVLRGCTFARNTAGTYGAAIAHNRDDLTGIAPLQMSECRFFANRSVQSGALNIRRPYYASDVIGDCDFYANETTGGGPAALWLYHYDGVVENCRFSGNTAAGSGSHGGAIYLSDSDATLRNVTIAGSVTAMYGGGVWTDNGSKPRFENVVLAGNRSRYGGGGVCVYDATDGNVAFVNCTVVDNRTTEPNPAYGGGGLYLRNGTFGITNSIVYGNRTAAGGGMQVHVNLSGDTVNVGYNDLEGGTGAVYVAAGATMRSGGGNLDAEPRFGDPRTGMWTDDAVYTNATGLTVLTDSHATWASGQLAGRLLNPDTNAGMLAYCIVTNTDTTVTVMGAATAGSTGAAYAVLDYRLRAFSPCVDAGRSAGAPAQDLAGTPRPQGGGVDMGVFEHVPDYGMPGPVTGLSAVGGQDEVALTWTNPPDADFDGVLIVRSEGAPPDGVPLHTNVYTVGSALGNGVVVYAGPGANSGPGAASGWTDGNAPALVPLEYAVFAYDTTPNYAPPAQSGEVEAIDGIPPGPVTGGSSEQGATSIILRWTNPTDADFAGVLILRRTGEAPTGAPVSSNRYAVGEAIGDGEVVYAGAGGSGVPGGGGAWTNTGLAESTAYFYAVFAYDEVPNYSAGTVIRGSTRKAGVWFVDADAAGLADGSSWADAFASPLAVLSRVSAGEEVWVAEGTYSPGPFQLATNVAYYGGFAGTESVRAARNWSTHPTILSGGGPVVKGAPGARLDGFTVTGGNAVNGGGFFMSGGTITVANCVFLNNQAASGGGLFLTGVQATIERCRIENNVASSGGGGLYAQTVYVAPAGVIRNCVFIGNRCEGSPDGKNDGGGIDLYVCPYRIENCTLYDNVTSRRGGGIKIYAGNNLENHVIKNCILWNNRLTDPPTGDYGGTELAIQQDSGSVPVIVQMSYTDWTPELGERLYTYYRDGVEKHVFSELMESDPAFADAGNGDLHLKSKAGRWGGGFWAFDSTNSPCIDAGNPLDAFDSEPKPNGDRVNMGAYGNTVEASRSGSVLRSGLMFTVR